MAMPADRPANRPLDAPAAQPVRYLPYRLFRRRSLSSADFRLHSDGSSVSQVDKVGVDSLPGNFDIFYFQNLVASLPDCKYCTAEHLEPQQVQAGPFFLQSHAICCSSAVRTKDLHCIS